MIDSQRHTVFADGGGGQFTVLLQPLEPGGQPLVGQLTVHCIVSIESQGFDKPPFTAWI